MQRADPGVARLFHFDGPHLGGQAEEPVNVHPGGFGLVNAGFGGEEKGTDSVSSIAVDDPLGGGGCHRDDVFVGSGLAHDFLADAFVELAHVDPVFVG